MGLRYTSVVDAPIAEVMAWFERPGALQRLLPPWQPIEVAEEATSLQSGRAVLRLPGGLHWVAQHSALTAGTAVAHDEPWGGTRPGFVDRLVSLPFPWRHTHEFEAVDAMTTRLFDTVDTPVPARFLRQTFRYRSHQLAGDLAAHRSASVLRAQPLTVAVTGSSGLVGSALCAYLSTGGHRVIRLVRREPQGSDERSWDPERPDGRALEGVDAVVHLAGASIAGRFTEAHKQLVRDSRVGPTRALAELMADLPHGPRVLVCASAIGFYGADRGDEMLTEESERGSGFLAGLVEEWEAAADQARAAGFRVVHVRTGIVQSARGGTLRLLRPLFMTGLGGPLSPGSQWVSWIGLDDLVDVFGRALVDDDLVGPVNAVAPEPVTNRQYTSILAHVLRRPAVIPVPGLGPRLLLGSEGAHETAEASQHVTPALLGSIGHGFRYPTLEGCLRHELGHDNLPAPGETGHTP